uniref:THAP domain-containing protein 1 n=1 Tax=Sparus aurata TaxID=8175 RepID=A0A671WB72_SPAAU
QPCRLSIVQGNGAISLFKFPKDDNVRKQWINFVKRSYCGEFKITINTRLCSVHFTPDSYSNYHQVKSGYLKSQLTLVSGAAPTLSFPSLHPPIPPTAGATIMATGIMCPPETVSVPPTADALNSTAGIMCPPATVSVLPTADSLNSAAGIMCPPVTVSVPPTADALNSATGIMCPPATLSIPPTTGALISVILYVHQYSYDKELYVDWGFMFVCNVKHGL